MSGKSALSRGVRMRVGGALSSSAPLVPGIPSSLKRGLNQTVKINGIENMNAHREETETRRRKMLKGLSNETKEALDNMHKDGGNSNPSGVHDEPMSVDNDDQTPIQANTRHSDDWVDERMTPEEIGQLVDAAVIDPKWTQRRYIDGRTARNKREAVTANWEPRLEAVTDAYLRWRYPPPATSSIPTETARDHALDYTVAVVDLYTLETETTVPRSEDDFTVVVLAEHGYLGNSPRQPTLAISLKTLELYRLLSQRKPSFSVESFAKVLCDLYQIPYRRKWRTALADAFDVFLSIRAKVDARIATALGRTDANWRVLNACPPCSYELEGEKPLRWRIIWAMDGNNSAKRVLRAYRQEADNRVFTSSYFVNEPEVNACALATLRVPRGPEVPSGREKAEGEDPTEAWDDEKEQEGQEGSKDQVLGGGSEKQAGECVRNWKAAQSDSKKRVMDMFDETGIFACGCRHGITLWVADMVQSGEQAKYPLVMIKRAVEVLGPRLLVGYDIGCAFESVIKSTTLGAPFARSESRCCVNAYHGYAHNFACQCRNHPNNIEGVGIEDMETMERLFSASNATASVIRYASKYRRRMRLDLFFQQYDKDRYANLGIMLRNNYKQALKIIEEGSPVLASIMRQLEISTEDLDRWQVEQAEFFATVGKEPDDDVHRIAYVELLEELRDAENSLQKRNTTFLNALPENYDITSGGTTYERELSDTRKAETQRKWAREKVSRLLLEIAAMEAKLGIETRWDASFQAYQDTLKYMASRKYHKALDNLQRLVVQRLFELHRLSLSGIGYRARSLLAKAMRTRSKAIQNAVSRYNDAARQLNREPLDWKRIEKYNFIEEFSLLRDGRRDIRSERWSDIEVREAMKLHQRIKRAREELERLNIEARRLYTSICDEHALFEEVSAELRTAGNLGLLGALTDFCTERCAVNQVILSQLCEIAKLEGYTGDEDLLGIRLGRKGKRRVEMHNVDASHASSSPAENGRADEEEGDEDEEEDVQVGGVLDFIAEVAST